MKSCFLCMVDMLLSSITIPDTQPPVKERKAVISIAVSLLVR